MVCLGYLTHGACIGHWTPDYSTRWRLPVALSIAYAKEDGWSAVVHAISMTCSLCWSSLCAACLYIITRPDSQLLCTRVYILWFSVAWGSATFWWQSNACDCYMFCACTRSGSPHKVMHFLVTQLHVVSCLKLTFHGLEMIFFRMMSVVFCWLIGGLWTAHAKVQIILI